MEIGEQKSYTMRNLKNILFVAFCYFAAAAAIIPLVILIAYVAIKGFSSLNLSFFINLPVPIGEKGGGMANAIFGTFMIVSIASLISFPCGIFSGLWLAEWGKGKRGFIIRYIVDIMSGIPSIVLGIFAYTLIVIPMKRFSAIAGGVAIALVMIPYITRSTEEIVKMVPRSLKESALALGIPERRVLLSIILRSSWNGIFTGIILAVARACGETAPLLFTSFNNLYWNIRPDQPTATMTVQIYNYAIAPFEEWNQMAWAGSLVLVCFVLLITLVVRKFSKRVTYG